MKQAWVGTALMAAGLTAAWLAFGTARAQDLSAATTPAALPKGFTTLYRFTEGTDGYFPRGGVLVDGGAIYGTTYYAGKCDDYPYCGILYKLTELKSGWKLSVLHYFETSLHDGIGPTAPLNLVGKSIVGTTSEGDNPNFPVGEVFRFVLPSSYTILKPPFTRATGYGPVGGVVVGKNGILFGTTNEGGTHDGGTIYKVSGWRVSTLYDLPGNPSNPASGPSGELMIGKDGAIYGTSYGNGKHNRGYVFRIEQNGTGFQSLHDFEDFELVGRAVDGADPEGRLAQGSDGTIYGTTTFGGSAGEYGTIWSLTPQAGGKWKYAIVKILGSDGNLPHSGLVMHKGVLYGTGAGGGKYQGGVIYSLTETSPGKWQYHLLHSFEEMTAGGDDPYAVLWNTTDAIYGTTLTGGHFDTDNCEAGCGTVFRYVP
jgi:uncharacterized repeat protein (TIGR03803 family)